jgi:hypothetical protein
VFGHQQATGTFRRSTSVSIGRSHPAGHSQQVNQVKRAHVGRARNLAMRHSTDVRRAEAADANGATVATFSTSCDDEALSEPFPRFWQTSTTRVSSTKLKYTQQCRLSLYQSREEDGKVGSPLTVSDWLMDTVRCLEHYVTKFMYSNFF